MGDIFNALEGDSTGPNAGRELERHVRSLSSGRKRATMLRRVIAERVAGDLTTDLGRHIGAVDDGIGKISLEPFLTASQLDCRGLVVVRRGTGQLVRGGRRHGSTAFEVESIGVAVEMSTGPVTRVIRRECVLIA